MFFFNEMSFIKLQCIIKGLCLPGYLKAALRFPAKNSTLPELFLCL